MPRNKPRLQLALYARPKHPGSYHYALFVAPKHDEGSVTKHHAKDTLLVNVSGEVSQPWRYEHTVVFDVRAEQRLLVRVIIAKASDKTCGHIRQVLESMPIYQVDEARQFSCRTWARDAYEELRRTGVITVRSEKWDDVERKTLEYLQRKSEQGRWNKDWKGGSGVPLMDLLEGKEVLE